MLMALSSCTTVRSLVVKEPKVALKQVKIDNISWSDINISVALDVTNPNSFDLTLLKVDYQVTALDLLLGEGESAKTLVIGAGQTSTVTLPLQLKPRAALKLAQRFLGQNKPVMAVLKGGVQFDTPLGAMRLEVQDEKQILNP